MKSFRLGLGVAGVQALLCSLDALMTAINPTAIQAATPPAIAFVRREELAHQAAIGDRAPGEGGGGLDVGPVGAGLTPADRAKSWAVSVTGAPGSTGPHVLPSQYRRLAAPDGSGYQPGGAFHGEGLNGLHASPSQYRRPAVPDGSGYQPGENGGVVTLLLRLNKLDLVRTLAVAARPTGLQRPHSQQ